MQEGPRARQVAKERRHANQSGPVLTTTGPSSEMGRSVRSAGRCHPNDSRDAELRGYEVVSGDPGDFFP
jgi:hypothetical protein